MNIRGSQLRADHSNIKFEIVVYNSAKLVYNSSTYRKELNMKSLQWWAYLHANGTVQLKRWFGDVKDYTDDCEGNDFVQRVVPPFSADTREEAMDIARAHLGLS